MTLDWVIIRMHDASHHSLELAWCDLKSHQEFPLIWNFRLENLTTLTWM